jgi:hypothetical protein
VTSLVAAILPRPGGMVFNVEAPHLQVTLDAPLPSGWAQVCKALLPHHLQCHPSVQDGVLSLSPHQLHGAQVTSHIQGKPC